MSSQISKGADSNELTLESGIQHSQNTNNALESTTIPQDTEEAPENHPMRLRRHASPIDRLTWDVLSLIFEVCGRIDWIDAVTISSICRLWRQCVLSTPRAWCFLTISQRTAPRKIRHYLPFGSQQPLHVSLLNDMGKGLTIFTAEAHRLHCLSTYSIPEYLDVPKFPNLEILAVSWIPAAFATEARFPSLQYFHCGGGFIDAQDVNIITSFPRMRTLSVGAAANNSTWVEV